MKVYDLYFKADIPKLMRKGLTEAQVDKFWSTLKWWEKESIIIKEREVAKEDKER